MKVFKRVLFPSYSSNAHSSYSSILYKHKYKKSFYLLFGLTSSEMKNKHVRKRLSNSSAKLFNSFLVVLCCSWTPFISIWRFVYNVSSSINQNAVYELQSYYNFSIPQRCSYCYHCWHFRIIQVRERIKDNTWAIERKLTET